jgi:hypothetical protein
MKWLLIVALMLVPIVSMGQEDPPKVEEVPVVVDPPKPSGVVWPKPPTIVKDVVPKPKEPTVDPNAVPTVTREQFYVVTSDVEFMLLVSPPTLSRVTYNAGPMILRGIFTDSNGEIETRTYTDKFIAVLDPVKGKVGDAELLYVPQGVKDEAGIGRKNVKIGLGPRPPPEPGPGPNPPGPTPEPTPVPTGFRVIMVYESSVRRPASADAIIYSPEITKFLTDNCVKGTNNVPEWRKWDKDVEITGTESPTMKELWTKSLPELGDVTTAPKLIVAVNGEAKVYPFPDSPTATLKFLGDVLASGHPK